jgi:glycosyltransferase involved in cell wall biosynthesis
VAHLRGKICAAQLELRPKVAHINLAYELARLDVNLVPLEQGNPFCDAKSPLKWYEAALAGTPSVVTGNELYRELLGDGAVGLIACNEPEWHQRLVTLANNAALRDSLADKAREKCISELNEEKSLKTLLDFIMQH